jgi:hypothetical protein
VIAVLSPKPDECLRTLLQILGEVAKVVGEHGGGLDVERALLIRAELCNRKTVMTSDVSSDEVLAFQLSA